MTLTMPAMTRRASSAALLALALPLLAGCSWFGGEEKLEGERIRIRENRDAAAVATGAGPSLGFDTAATVAGTGPALPPPQRLAEWPQKNGAPTRNSGHLSGPASLDRAWTADAGTGGSDSGAITSPPVAAAGRVYTLDAGGEVRAFDAQSGAEAWETSIAPEGEGDDEGFGGGLAFANGQLFASTGFGEVLALNAGSGEILWRAKLGAPSRAAPAVAGGVVVAVARDNRAFGVDAATGEILWRAQGATSGAAFLAGASPAIAANGAVLPFGSGEVVAVDLRSGQRYWAAVISGGRRGLARSAISDVTGDPIVVGPLIVAANQAGRIVALTGRNGRRAWTRSIGVVGPIWAAGSTLFVVTDTAALMRLDARSGATIWQQQLPAFEDEEDREDPIGYSGPVLVEGRVLVSSSLGELLAFDGVGGAPAGVTDLTGGSRTGPIVAGDTLFILTDDGTLEAYR